MKRIISIIIILCLLTSVCGCKAKPHDIQQATPIISENDSNEKKQEIKVDTNDDQENQNDIPKETVKTPEKESNPSTETKTEDTPTVENQSENNTQEEDVFIIQGETSIESAEPFEVDLTFEVDLRLACVLGTDMFTAKVVEVIPLPKDTEFFSLDTPGAIPMMYTVEVEEVFKDFIVTPKSTIQVVDYMIEDGTSDNWDNALEAGKTYLFGGWAEPYGKKPIIVCHGLHSAQIKEDGTLEYCSKNAEISLKGINTLNDIITNETVADIIYSKTDSALLYEPFYELTNIPTDEGIQTNDTEQQQPTFEQVISELKEAIKIDSDKVLKTPEASDK